MRAFADSNILLYSISKREDEVAKRAIARQLLTTQRCVLSVQVLNEFVWQSTRSTRAERISDEAARQLSSEWSRLEVQALDLAVFDGAWTIAARTNYTWWDCLIIAAAQASRCDTLYTEDMQHGHVIDDLRIENPFRDLAP